MKTLIIVYVKVQPQGRKGSWFFLDHRVRGCREV